MVKKNGKYVFNSDLSTVKKISTNITMSTVTTLNEFKEFFQVPSVVYQDDEYWVPPFWIETRDFFRRRNPFWTHAEIRLFIARKNKSVVGRIAAIIDYTFCEINQKNIGFFGFFECIQDYDIASELFTVAEEWLSSKGMSIMYGPINGRVDIGCGFLFYGFNSSPSILSSYSPKYYLKFSERFGMKKSRDQFTYYLDLSKPTPDELKKEAKQCEAKGIKIRKFNRLQTHKDMNLWITLMMETFSEHWGFIPVSSEEIKMRFGVNKLRWFVDTKLFLFAEVDKKPIAFQWSNPDYNQVFKKMNGTLGGIEIIKFLIDKRKINQGKFDIIGCKKEFRNKSIASLMNYYSIIEMKKRGYKGIEIGWVDEHNTASLRIMEKMGAKLCKKFRVYEKII